VIPLLVVLGAAVGAPLRYAADRVIQSRHRTGFPWGTFSVNAAASLILGLTLGAGASPEVTALVGAGFCGALSTYSTFGLETVQLAARGARAAAVGNVIGSVLTCLAAAAAGLALGSAAL
jgi:fluoride exporter